MVSQSVENCDVAIDGYSKKAAHRSHHRDADHGVKDIVHLSDEMIFDNQLLVVEQVDDDGFPGVGDAHQHVGHSQAADEEVHGRVQVLVFHNGADDQDVLQKTDDAEDEEHLGGDVELLACFWLGLCGVEWVEDGAGVDRKGPERRDGDL